MSDEPHASCAHSGVFADFICRSGVKLEALQKGENLLRKKINLSTQSRATAFEHLSRETLFCNIMKLLTPYWKAHSDSEWAYVGLGSLVQHARLIGGYVKRTELLTVAVKNFLATRKRGDAVPAQIRTDSRAQMSSLQLEQFWSGFQATARTAAGDALTSARSRPTTSSRPRTVSRPVTALDPHIVPRQGFCSTPASTLSAPTTARPATTRQSCRRQRQVKPQIPKCAFGHPCPEGMRVCRICAAEVPATQTRQVLRNVAQAPATGTSIPKTSSELQSQVSAVLHHHGARPHRLEPLTNLSAQRRAEHSGQNDTWRMAARSRQKGKPALPPPDIASDGAGRDYQLRRVFDRFLTRPFDVPGGSGSGPQIAEVVSSLDTSCVEYFRECHLRQLPPKPIPFIVEGTSDLAVADLMLTDRDLNAIAKTVPDAERIRTVNLEGNCFVTDASAVPFLAALDQKQTAAQLTQLSLNRCKGLGYGAFEMLVKTLESGLRCLHSLDLGSTSIPMTSYVSLCDAISGHCCLEVLCLADTGLGNNRCAKNCVDAVLGCTTLKSLDLGWSRFDADVFCRIGDRLAGDHGLRSLRVPSCSTVPASGQDHSIEYFLEALSANTSLTYLDISANLIDYRGALVLEDAFGQHRTLTTLDISNNNFGVQGLRSVVRLLVCSSSGLKRLENHGCASGSAPWQDEDSRQLFSPSHPGGRYSLVLSRPYHRTLLRMLYRACERFCLTPSVAFKDLLYSLGAYSHPSRGKDGAWQVQTQGLLTTTFVVGWSGLGFNEGIAESRFSSFLELHFDHVRLQPDARDMLPLFAHWFDLADMQADFKNQRLLMLEALSRDLLLTYPQLLLLLKSAPDSAADILLRTVHCLSGGLGTRYLALMNTPSLGDLVMNAKRMHNLFGFNAENPSWNYSLDLSLVWDHSIAERLLLLDRWEVDIDMRQQRVDTSQFGDQSHIRNAMHREKSLRMHNIADWHLPNSDVLAFDYSTGKRPPAEATVLDVGIFASVLRTLQQSDLHPQGKVETLRLVSSHMYLTCFQLRELLSLMPSDSLRGDTFVLFYFRLVDVHNEKVCRLRDKRQRGNLLKRLGYITFFPFIQPEHASFQLDFAHYDQRLAANCLLTYALQEKFSNIREPIFIRADGTPDDFTSGIPRSWTFLDQMPTGGVFECRYICAPEDRNYSTRKASLKKFAWFQCTVTEKEVNWWSALSDAPADLPEFVEYLVSNFQDVYTAFKYIDGRGGNGKITLVEMTERLKAHGFKKFKGPDEARRIEAVFRYLDPGGEGTVSINEWAVLEQLEKDILLALQEFAAFLERSFGEEHGVLDRAWHAWDTDGNGEITEKEWHKLLEQQLEYFGPDLTVFHCLDIGDEGSISMSEFKSLERFTSCGRAENQPKQSEDVR